VPRVHTPHGLHLYYAAPPNGCFTTVDVGGKRRRGLGPGAIPHYHPATEVEIGKFMKETIGYRWTSRRAAEPIAELDTIDRFEASRRDERQPEFPIGTTDDERPASSPTDWREAAIIRKRRMNGYDCGSLEEARATFKAALGDLPMEWDAPG